MYKNYIPFIDQNSASYGNINCAHYSPNNKLMIYLIFKNL